MKNEITMNSYNLDGGRVLALNLSCERAEKFLAEVANLRDDNEAIGRFLAKYADLLPSHAGAVTADLGSDDSMRKAMALRYNLERVENPGAMYFYTVREELRSAWRQPTALSRQISLMGLLWQYATGHPQSIHADPFTVMLVRALQIADRMRYCGNSSCPAPYFVARRRSQKYCGDACSLPAQREHKRSWWLEHGEEWRRTSKGKRKKRGAR